MSDTSFSHYAPVQPGAPAPPTKGSNGPAVAGFILGLIGFLGSWIPFVNLIGILLGLVGLVLAGIGLVKSKKANSGRGLSIAGIVLSVLAVVIALVVNVALVDAVDKAIDENSKSTNSPAGESDDKKDSSFVDGVLTTPEVKIVITNHKVIPVGQKGNEYGEKPVIAFWYKITNLTDKDVDPTNWIFLISAFQDNNPNSVNELAVASLPDDRFLETQLENIKKGGTVENAMAYELDDLSTPVDLVASELLDDEIGRVTYKLK